VASNKFGFELYARVKAGQKNLICSPVSVSIALAMTLAGARSETWQEMSRVLNLDATRKRQAHVSFGNLLDALNKRDGQEGLALRVADRLWGQKGLALEPVFLGLLRDRYKAPLEVVDFANQTEEARVSINRWAAAQTHDRIRDVLQPGDLSSDSRLVITNAVYFKGEWEVRFRKEETADQLFATPDGKVVAKMMHKAASLRYAHAGSVQIVELVYRGGLSMVVVLPDAVDGLDAVETRLASSYQGWLKTLDFKPVDLKLPRWTVTSRVSLVSTLAAMGMPTAFTGRATFTGIAKAQGLRIDQVLQQAFVNVDEEGTEAAAVTAVVAGSISETLPVVFHADHPFVYLIRDTETGAILFIGRLGDPR
jgi:serpin B